jgi:hypothetical protein
MHWGFVAMFRSTSSTVPLKFKDGFGDIPFVSATYYQNVAKWCLLDSKEQEMAVAKGRVNGFIFSNTKRTPPLGCC